MSLRTWLAGKAMASLVIVAATSQKDVEFSEVAKEAVAYADALIAELEKS